MNRKGILIIVSGFSGAGKGTIMKELTSRYEQYALSVSATTRAPRPGEEDGVAYFFRTKKEFEQMIEDGALIEYARYVDNYYGTPKAYVEEQLAAGHDYLVVNDVLEECVEQVHGIIDSEHQRIVRHKEKISKIREELKAFAKGE